MGRLRDEIVQFLTDEGFHCVGESQSLIHTVNPHRWILPVETAAASPQEAEAQSERRLAYIEDFRNMTGTSPICITEDWWRARPAMMRQRLLSHMGKHFQVYARNCEVRRIEKAEAAAFLNEAHSYGDAACRYRYGLFLKRHTGHIAQELGQAQEDRLLPGSLVAVATFSNARKWSKGDKFIRSYEWTRYASLPQVRVNGGMGKLLRAFIEEVGPDDIMSYADLEWSEGGVYEQLGFIREQGKGPVCFSIDGESWERRTQLDAGEVFYCNFGSAKYRLKLTEYE